MTNKIPEEQLLNDESTNIMTAAFTAFTVAVPDWTTMPATAIFTFLDDQLYNAREWAFKAHSPTHAEAWKERVLQYQKAMPKAADLVGEEPEVTDELGKTLMLIVGASIGLLAQTLDLVDLETGEINFENVWTDEFLQSEQYAQMSAWGDQSFTWIVLKLRDLAHALCPMVMLYESQECDASEVVNRALPILVLSSAVLFLLAIEHLDEDTKEQIGRALAEVAEAHTHAPQEVN